MTPAEAVNATTANNTPNRRYQNCLVVLQSIDMDRIGLFKLTDEVQILCGRRHTNNQLKLCNINATRKSSSPIAINQHPQCENCPPPVSQKWVSSRYREATGLCVDRACCVTPPAPWPPRTHCLYAAVTFWPSPPESHPAIAVQHRPAAVVLQNHYL